MQLIWILLISFVAFWIVGYTINDGLGFRKEGQIYFFSLPSRGELSLFGYLRCASEDFRGVSVKWISALRR